MSTKKTVTTMAELLETHGSKMVVPKKGTVLTGTISRKAKNALYVELGAKAEGVVAEKEFDIASDYIAELEVGQPIEVQVVSDENNQGQVMLSLKKAALDSKWDFFTQAMENGDTLDAKGVEVNKGGLVVLVSGVRGFVPSSQFGRELSSKYAGLKGKNFPVKTIEVDREKNRLIFSERHVSEEGEIAQKSEALHAVKAGEIYDGTVSGVMHFGLFVTVEVPMDKEKGSVEGLVHISEISWEKVGHPKDYHKVGDKVKVRVLGIDDRTGKLNLSIKQLSDDPWLSIEERYQPGTTVSGTVSRVESFGVFVNVEAGVDGLIHNSKIEQGQTYTKGESVTVNVESVSATARRMSLSPVMTQLPVEYR